jgi:hypothetical protein
MLPVIAISMNLLYIETLAAKTKLIQDNRIILDLKREEGDGYVLCPGRGG